MCCPKGTSIKSLMRSFRLPTWRLARLYCLENLSYSVKFFIFSFFMETRMSISLVALGCERTDKAEGSGKGKILNIVKPLCFFESLYYVSEFFFHAF